MKNIKLIIATGALLSLISCGESFLDRPPKDQFSIELAYTSLSNIEGAVLGLYERGRSHIESNDVCLYKACVTDLVEPGTNLTDQQVFNQIARLADFNATNTGVRDIWNALYVGLHRANSILASIDEVTINEAVADEVNRRNKVKGEALFFRAFFHLELVQRWDNIVLADKVFTDPNEKLVLAKPQDVYALIVTDLEQAITLLPTAIETGTRGRISVGTAHHVLSKALMDMGDWSSAATHAVAVINDPSYSLVDVNTVFSTSAQENSEIILSWQFNQSDPDHPQRVSQQFYPLYDRCNGVARSFEQGGRPWARLIPSDYYWTLFTENDLRLEAWHKRYWIYDINDSTNDPLPAGVSLGDTVTAENINETVGLGMAVVQPTTNKYFEGGELGRTIDDAQGYRNIIEFRLSEAYLIAAEAYLNAGNASTGQQYLDAVRTRADVASIPLNEQNILDEYARELGHEGHRWAILKRKGILVSSVKAHSPETGSSMQDFHVRWPIPKVFVDLTKVPQNEGYE